MTGPLVLLPGMNCSDRLWGPVAQRLRSEGVDSLTRPLVGATMDDCVDSLLSSLPDRFALAGLSLGGIVAMALVRRAPERVSMLCLMSTSSRGPTAEQRAAWTAQRQALAGGATARDVQHELLPVLLAPRNRRAELDEWVLRMADDVGAAGLDGHLAIQGTRIDERTGLSRVTVPTLLLAGARDVLCPPDRHTEMLRLIPRSRLEIIEGAGHLVPLEAPDQAAAAMAAWLRAAGCRGVAATA
ncbi:MAG TPA: alpha/beta fold hydrolase [Actinokineospora sp.]|nr:alpha/beta fold hydrolase [Actinokineospora sp.]